MNRALSNDCQRIFLTDSLPTGRRENDLVPSRKDHLLIQEAGGTAMAMEVKCPPCCETISGATDDELVANVIGHAKIHGHVIGDTDRDEILASAREV